MVDPSGVHKPTASGAPSWSFQVQELNQGVTGRAARYRCERGVGKIAAHLNGVDYVDGYDTDIQEDEAA